MYENQVSNSVKNFAGDEKEKKESKSQKNTDLIVCAKACQPSRSRSLCGHCEVNLSSSQFAMHRGLNFNESSQTLSGGRISCNSFPVQDPFGSHYSSEEKT